MALRESGEDYLESIYVLSERQGTVRSIDVAEYLGVTKASVSKAMATLGKQRLCQKWASAMCT